jgi:hypothetical protein
MKKTIADTITDKIKKGDLTMRSRISIWFGKLGVNGGMAGLAGLLVLVSGLLFYWINSNNDLLLGGYGRYGLSSFIQSFPYVLVFIFISLFVFLIIIFRTFDFSYKKHFLPILLFIFVGIVVVGWISMRYPLGQRFYQEEGSFMRMGMMNNSNAISGIVTEIDKDSITVRDENDKETVIAINKDTHFPFGQPKKGDAVRSVGEWTGNMFGAFGVRVFDESNPSTLGPGMMRGRGQGRGMMRNQ